MQQERRPSVVSYHQIHEPVIVEINERDSTDHVRRLQPTAGFLARFDELPVAFVVKLGVELLVVDIRHGLLDLGIDVAICDEQIQPSIVVIVEEASTETQHLARWHDDPAGPLTSSKKPFPPLYQRWSEDFWKSEM